MYVHWDEAHFTYIFFISCPMYLRLETFTKNLPKCNIAYIFLLFLFRSGAPPMTLLTAGAWMKASNDVCTIDACPGVPQPKSWLRRCFHTSVQEEFQVIEVDVIGSRRLAHFEMFECRLHFLQIKHETNGQVRRFVYCCEECCPEGLYLENDTWKAWLTSTELGSEDTQDDEEDSGSVYTILNDI